MKPKRGKKKRSRVRAGVAEVGEPGTRGATVETTDAELDQVEADASPVDDVRADAGVASEDSASPAVDEVEDVPEEKQGDLFLLGLVDEGKEVPGVDPFLVQVGVREEDRMVRRDRKTFFHRR